MNMLSRRSAIRKLTGTTALLGAASTFATRVGGAESATAPKLKGHINHSACKWCYGKLSLEEFCQAAKEIGLRGIDLLEVREFATLKKYDLVCSMVSGVPGGIGQGLNRIENHDKITRFMEDTIPVIAEHGYPNVICFSGNRAGMSDEQGLENCATGLKRIAPVAEKYKVTLIVELLNSKHDHKDYMCDHTAWGAELCKRVGSDRVKLLYDIYHMQIMEGDIIATIRQYHQYIGHYHTGGVPGRGEIDSTQEINYPAVMEAIVKTGYKGFVAQEFVPKRPEPLKSLRECVQICDV